MTKLRSTTKILPDAPDVNNVSNLDRLFTQLAGFSEIDAKRHTTSTPKYAEHTVTRQRIRQSRRLRAKQAATIAKAKIARGHDV